MKLEAVFFDFDGVICDSVNIKSQAFAEIYREYGKEIEDKVVKYHLQNGGVSRYEKFTFWHKEYLNKELQINQLEELAMRFSKLVFKKILNARFIDGAIETLEELKKNKTPAYVVSATPENELKKIIKKRKLENLFTKVYGSPKSKNIIVKEILDVEKYNPSKCLFIGDALSDLKAAQSNKIHFLGIYHNDNDNIFPKTTRVSRIVSVLDF